MPEASPSQPPTPIEPSTGVRLVREFKDVVTDLAGMALAAHLVGLHAISGEVALGFVLVLVLPPNVVRKYAQVVLAKGGGSPSSVHTALVLLSTAATLATIKTALVGSLGAVVVIAACTGN